ncbi:hypothetical protein HOF92_11140, partial [bacterium]|nr:hypothetical protein [bacterium]
MYPKTSFWLALLFTGVSLAAKPTRNLEEFGFSPQMEKYRQRVSIDFQQSVPTVGTSREVPSPVLPRLETNYS